MAYPALDLIECYHERWEIELAIDEIDTHQRLPNQPFRSRKPIGVIQEFYAMLIAHYIHRTSYAGIRVLLNDSAVNLPARKPNTFAHLNQPVLFGHLLS